MSRFEDVNYFINFGRKDSLEYMWVSYDERDRPKPRSKHYSITVGKANQSGSHQAELQDLGVSMDTLVREGKALALTRKTIQRYKCSDTAGALMPASVAAAPQTYTRIRVAVQVCQ